MVLGDQWTPWTHSLRPDCVLRISTLLTEHRWEFGNLLVDTPCPGPAPVSGLPLCRVCACGVGSGIHFPCVATTEPGITTLTEVLSQQLCPAMVLGTSPNLTQGLHTPSYSWFLLGPLCMTGPRGETRRLIFLLNPQV